MKDIKYIYNPKTCQYERARIGWRDVVITVFGTLFTALLLFVGIVFIHNKFVTTEYEQKLRSENKVMREHKPLLEQTLTDIETALAGLHGEENELYTKLFNTTPPQEKAKTSTLSKENTLLADASGFKSMLDVVSDRSGELFTKSTDVNTKFHNDIHIDKEDVAFITSLPSIKPVADLQSDMLVSGFGRRVNPFHKGMYMHPGADFVAPRGTAVLATANGKVADINRNDLQAGYGNSIVLDHGRNFSTRYAHLEEILVKPGQTVTKGMVIGTVGNSGGSVAPHLHYEVIRDGEHVDPVLYLLEGLDSKQHAELLERSTKPNQSLD
jgi:murein DD-endopeptidase MepM/ murein hydrolase activator NlpD